MVRPMGRVGWWQSHAVRVEPGTSGLECQVSGLKLNCLSLLHLGDLGRGWGPGWATKYSFIYKKRRCDAVAQLVECWGSVAIHKSLGFLPSAT